MIQVRYTDISGLKETEYAQLFHRACPTRQKRAERYLRQEDRHRCIIADALLRYALRQQIGTDQLPLAQTPKGKPYLADRSDFHFNISHSGRWVVIAWADTPVGIDVETVAMDKGKLPLARRFFHPDEQDYLFASEGQEQARRFFEIWTKKESYLKYLGTGIDRSLNSFNVLHISDIRFCTHFLEDAALTLCTEQEDCQILPLTVAMLISE